MNIADPAKLSRQTTNLDTSKNRRMSIGNISKIPINKLDLASVAIKSNHLIEQEGLLIISKLQDKIKLKMNLATIGESKLLSNFSPVNKKQEESNFNSKTVSAQNMLSPKNQKNHFADIVKKI